LGQPRCRHAYEWYVSVNDGTEGLNSSRRTFTTAANLAPVVNVTAPAPGATFVSPANVVISADASDPDGQVSYVEFYANGELLGTDPSSPYEWTWAAVPQGTYAITAKAYDNDDTSMASAAVNITVNAPDNVPPTVSITSPANGATYETPVAITITATAADPDGTITKVEFFKSGISLGEDTLAPYELVWSDVGIGTYSLTAVAYDNKGASTISTAVGVTVLNPPAVVRGPYARWSPQTASSCAGEPTAQPAPACATEPILKP